MIANQYDSIQITEKDPCCFGLFKRCGNFSGHIMARGREIRVSFISDWILTRKGFSLYWKGTTVMFNCFITAIHKIFFITGTCLYIEAYANSVNINYGVNLIAENAWFFFVFFLFRNFCVINYSFLTMIL